MRIRLTIAAIVIVAGVIAVAALKFFGTQAPQQSQTATSSGPSPIATETPAPSLTQSPDVSVSGAPTPESSISDISASAAPTPEPTSTPTASPSPAPTPSTDPNLLSMRNGAFVRRWTLGAVPAGPEYIAEDATVTIATTFTHPVEFVFELPSAAHLDRVGVSLRGAKAAHAEADVAVGSDPHALRAVGTVNASLPADNDREQFVNVGANARFVRFAIRRNPNAELVIVRLAGYGTQGQPPYGALAGTWVSADTLTGSADSVFAGVLGAIPDALPPHSEYNPLITTEQDGVLSSLQCSYRTDPWQAPVEGNVARFTADRLQLAGNGNLLVGYASGVYVMALRSKPVGSCLSSVSGNGPTVLALVRVVDEPAAEIDPAFVPGYRFERHMTSLLEASQLARARFAVLDSDCSATRDLSKSQQKMLLQWIAAGHKLIIRDADRCSASDYSFVPYHFSTAATGARGARGDVLEIADPSTLGSGPSDPTHAVDTAAYLKNKEQQVGDADVMQTDDARWCGHMFTTNVLNQAGWVHAYARYGRGLIIYDGFDRDDVSNKVPAALRVVQLEYAQPVQAELPCNAHVASMLVLAPSVDESLPAGKAAVVRVPMRLAYAAKDAGAQDIALSIAGDARYAASVSPVRVHLTPGTGSALVATVQLPKGWSGTHAFTVTATGTPPLAAQASIQIGGAVGIAKAFESQRRVRIYGIHFDVDSAKIQPISEATIAQIAQVLDAHRDWKMRVEGHTDSDGGAAYNMALSIRRAQSVVADLVARYHIAGSRLTSAGFGLTRPVASNATEAGKALNRRVELVRL